MKTRKLALGNKNIIGSRVTQARQALGMKQVELLARLQTAGVDMSVPALSLLEGQKRPASDIELNALANKGAGLLALCGHLGIDPAQAMALGDGSNDLAMIQAAGLGVAMANADPAVLAAADYVTGSNDESGVAQAIEKFVL